MRGSLDRDRDVEAEDAKRRSRRWKATVDVNVVEEILYRSRYWRRVIGTVPSEATAFWHRALVSDMKR